jgi:hypothetical protein
MREKRKRFPGTDLRGNTLGHLMNGRNRKDERRKEAFAREEAWGKLPTAEKLKRLPHDGANRQRARYTEQLKREADKTSQVSDLITEAKQLVADGKAVRLSEAKRQIKQRRTTAAAS